jgi:hypothetical protein
MKWSCGRYGIRTMGLSMTSAKILRPENTNPCLNNKEGEDVPFGPPPEEYSYCCSQCRHEMKVNEAIIDFEIGMAEFAGTYYEGFMPIVGCPNCNQETMEYVKD